MGSRILDYTSTGKGGSKAGEGDDRMGALSRRGRAGDGWAGLHGEERVLGTEKARLQGKQLPLPMTKSSFSLGVLHKVYNFWFVAQDVVS